MTDAMTYESITGNIDPRDLIIEARERGISLRSIATETAHILVGSTITADECDEAEDIIYLALEDTASRHAWTSAQRRGEF